MKAKNKREGEGMIGLDSEAEQDGKRYFCICTRAEGLK